MRSGEDRSEQSNPSGAKTRSIYQLWLSRMRTIGCSPAEEPCHHRMHILLAAGRRYLDQLCLVFGPSGPVVPCSICCA